MGELHWMMNWVDTTVLLTYNWQIGKNGLAKEKWSACSHENTCMA